MSQDQENDFDIQRLYSSLMVVPEDQRNAPDILLYAKERGISFSPDEIQLAAALAIIGEKSAGNQKIFDMTNELMECLYSYERTPAEMLTALSGFVSTAVYMLALDLMDDESAPKNFTTTKAFKVLQNYILSGVELRFRRFAKVDFALNGQKTENDTPQFRPEMN